MALDWKVYPSGADVMLFDGAMHIAVVQEGTRWSAMLRAEPPGSGMLFPTQKALTREAAMRDIETWLREHAERLLKLIDT